jgi:hypothetical protein
MAWSCVRKSLRGAEASTASGDHVFGALSQARMVALLTSCDSAASSGSQEVRCAPRLTGAAVRPFEGHSGKATNASSVSVPASWSCNQVAYSTDAAIANVEKKFCEGK